MAKHSKLAMFSLPVLAAAALFSACEDNGVSAPSGGEMRLVATPDTVVIDVAGGADSGQTELTAQVFDEGAFALRGVSIYFASTAGTVHTVCASGTCEQIGGQCNADVDCALSTTQAVETNVNGFAIVRLTLTRTDPETVTVSAASGLLTQSAEVGRTDDFGNQPPVAVIEATPTDPVLKGIPVTFDGRLSDDPDGLISCYQWQISSSEPGSNEVLQGLNTTSVDRSYNAEQSLTVTLRVSDDPALDDPGVCQPIPGGGVQLNDNRFNGSSTLQYQVVCSFTGPSANAGPDFAAGLGDVTVRGGGSAAGDATITEYRWDCRDGIHQFQFSEDATCTYNTPGTFTAELQVTTDCGDVDTDTVNIFVN